MKMGFLFELDIYIYMNTHFFFYTFLVVMVAYILDLVSKLVGASEFFGSKMYVFCFGFCECEGYGRHRRHPHLLYNYLV